MRAFETSRHTARQGITVETGELQIAHERPAQQERCEDSQAAMLENAEHLLRPPCDRTGAISGTSDFTAGVGGVAAIQRLACTAH
jgi:hypothetical protein